MNCIARIALSFALGILATAATAQRSYDVDILRDTFGFDESTEKTVALDDLVQGCPARDCIPSIEDPVYVSADDATFIGDDEYVIAIGVGDDYRVYPTRILDQHEIVNDTIGGEPIAITWCPLCGSAVGMRREVDGTVTEFGVSGVLYNSDLVLYDRATGTLWDQIEARGIVGPMTGHELDMVPVTLTRWSTWRDAHPDTLILSPDTRPDRDYTHDRYARYRDSDRLMFPVSREDNRIRPKTVVYGFDLDDGTLAVTASKLEAEGRLETMLGETTVTISRNDDGSVVLTDAEGERHAPIRLFWFAWYTFHPETALLE